MLLMSSLYAQFADWRAFDVMSGSAARFMFVSLGDQCVHVLTHVSCWYTQTCLLAHSLTHSLTYSLSHSPTCSLTHCMPFNVVDMWEYRRSCKRRWLRSWAAMALTPTLRGSQMSSTPQPWVSWPAGARCCWLAKSLRSSAASMPCAITCFGTCRT